MEDFFSYILYIGTFLTAFILNNKADSYPLKRVFVIWLYIFLCFGYLTGSDWSAYEIFYQKALASDSESISHDIGFNFLFALFSSVITDFFLTLGILKCVYLTTLIKLLKKYTTNWLSTIAILFPVSLLYILIDNPLRFMIALIFVNLGLIMNFDSKKISYLFFFLAPLFHVTSIVFITFPVMLKLSKRISSVNIFILGISYIGIVFISSNASLIENIKNSVVGQILLVAEIKDYTQSYNVENEDAFFTLGSMIQILIFFLVLSSKFFIIFDEKIKNFFGMTIFYFFVSKILVLIPTGFRLAIPFGYFYACYLAYLLSKKKLVGYLISLYLSLVMVKNITKHYVYLPYTNSIYHIITQDYASYSERSNYNLKKYFERNGKHFEF